ncbi:MAG: HDOD domain-containing protein, partial [Planctomycetaceae bacterium]|nr:HDOD domain-containing protein [Planctomycetaceae bacterium]
MDWGELYRQRIAEAGDLPLLTRSWAPRAPRYVTALSMLSGKGTLSADKLRELIERDPELTSQVLRQVNSCSAGLSTRIHTVSRAIGLLGQRRCQMLVLSAMLQASLRMTQLSAAQLERFISESLERAVFARLAADALGGDYENAYVGALLQDLLLPQVRHSHDSDYQKHPHAERLVEFEQRQFGWNHAVLTARVLKAWNLPDSAVCAVLLSHDHRLICNDPALRSTSLLAVTASALLPDAFHQEPGGVRQLMELQEQMPHFNFLQLALEVDDELAAIDPAGEHRISLCDRLAQLAIEEVEQARQEIVWTNQRIGNYILEREVGQGSMGLVYYARHATLHREAAIKLMKQRTLDPEALDRFEAEARITSSLRSPHTVNIYDYGVTQQGVLYYVMEWLNGISLGDLVERYGPQPPARVVHILRQACESLSEAHALGMIHRDVKPDNIVLLADDRESDFVKVVDFGLVKSMQPGAETPGPVGAVCGT